MGISDSSLGERTDYPKSFSRDLLSRIPRSDSRDLLSEDSGESRRFGGYDLWTLYELSWVSTGGAPNAVVGEIRVPVDSEFIVESKSLKLYLNSLYYRRFDSADQVQEEIKQSLDELLHTQVTVHLWPLADFGLPTNTKQKFVNLDLLTASGKQLSESGAGLLAGEASQGYANCYKTDCFRSLCPVTGQPDWASIYIGIKGVKVDQAGLAAYLYGYSEHQGFHESCVEKIYVDLARVIEPEELSVAARFTRRGGIDINPYRTSSKPLFDLPARTVRQ